MPSVPKEFIHNIDGVRGLKANKNYTHFHYRFKVDRKEFTKRFDFSKQTSWTPKTRKDEAKRYALAFKEGVITGSDNPFNPDTKLSYAAEEYFSKSCGDTKWNKERKRLYELHIEPHLANKKVSHINEHSIDIVRKDMETANKHKYKAGGSSIRSIEKVLFQVLKPILVYAESNGAISKLPKINIPNRPKRSQRKKRVKNASEIMVTLFRVIQERYKDDPFYRALFLLALQGRRWKEIATLEWTSIDFAKGIYTIEAAVNKIGIEQEYFIPHDVKRALLERYTPGQRGLVFPSPKTGRVLSPPRKQLKHIIDESGVEQLTMHYFRHILSTALAETGMAPTVLSASLGHSRTDTVDMFYKSPNHLRGSKDANDQISNILGGVE